MRTSDKPMKRQEYEKELRTLQIELCALQDWVRERGLRVIVVFEGRDAAGKGGTIKALTERVSPRVFRVVALPAPSDRERSQLYVQRFVEHFPAAGEVVILQILFTYAPPLQYLFDNEALPLGIWPWLVLGGLLFFLLVEAEKLILRICRPR